MKAFAFSLLALAVVVAVLAVSHEASATANCQTGGSAPSNADVCDGISMVGTTTGGVLSGRCFFLHTSSTPPACSTGGIGTTSNRAWELNAGACTTVYYHNVANGATPPATPNKVQLQVYVDTTATLILTFVAPPTAAPASGTSYTFCATSNGLTGSSPRAGTYYLALVAIKDDGVGGVGNYNVNANGAGTQDTSHDSGLLRSAMFVSSVARNAYPSGSTFAYGTSGDETITITSTFTQPNGDNNVETMFNSVVDASTLTVGQVGSTVDIDATTTLAQNFVADNTFTAANSPYVPGMTLVGNSVGSGNQKWTVLAATGHGAGLTRVSDTFIYDGSFNINPEIKFDSDGAGTFAGADDEWINKLTTSGGAVVSKYNRGETAYVEGYIFNARDQQLTRSMTIGLEDASAVVCNSGVSLTPSSGKYSTTYAVPTGGSCTVANTDAGSPRYIRATNTDQNHRSVQDHAVSSLYYVDSHIQVASTLVPDDYPTEDAGEYFTYLIQGDGMGGDVSDTVRQWCHVDGVRHDTNIDTSGSAVTATIKDPTATTRATGTTDTGSDGWTPTSLNLLATTPLGNTWTALCSVAFSGNTGTDTETFEITVAGGGGGDIFTGDPLKIFGGDEAFSGETVRLAVSEAFLDGTARTGNAAGTFIRILNAANTLVVTDANPTEVSHGVYRYDWTPSATGAYVVLARTTDPDSGDPIGTANIVVVRDPSEAFIFDNSTENATLALLLDKLGPLGDPVNIESATLDFWVPVILWLVALLFFLKLSKLMAAAASTVGLGVSLLIPDDFGWQIFALLVLAVSLWLEAFARDQIYARFFREPNTDRD